MRRKVKQAKDTAGKCPSNSRVVPVPSWEHSIGDNPSDGDESQDDEDVRRELYSNRNSIATSLPTYRLPSASALFPPFPHTRRRGNMTDIAVL